MSHGTLITVGILGAAAALCFVLGFASAGTSPAFDKAFLFTGFFAGALGYVAVGLRTRNALWAAVVPIACMFSAVAGNMIPYEFSIWGQTIEDKFRGDDNFGSWLDASYLALISVYALLAYIVLTLLGVAIYTAVSLLRRAVGQSVNDIEPA